MLLAQCRGRKGTTDRAGQNRKGIDQHVLWVHQGLAGGRIYGKLGCLGILPSWTGGSLAAGSRAGASAVARTGPFGRAARGVLFANWGGPRGVLGESLLPIVVKGAQIYWGLSYGLQSCRVQALLVEASVQIGLPRRQRDVYLWWKEACDGGV